MPELTAVNQGAGRFGAVQLVVVELVALVLAVSAVALPPLAAGLAVVGAGLLLAVALGRYSGRWGYEAVAARRRLRHRQRAGVRAARRPAGGGPRRHSPGLAVLAPDLTFAAANDRGTAIGVGEDGLGWFAALAVTPGAGVLRLDQLGRLLAEATVPVSTLQVVTRYVPAPSAGLDARTPCALSYRELVGAASVPIHQETWLAARLGPRDAADAAAGRGGGPAGVHRALAAILSRASTALTAAEVGHRVLDVDGLRQALTVVCGLETASGRAYERWAYWHAGATVQVCFAVRAWPANPHPGLLTELARVPGATTVVTSNVLRPLRDPGGGTAGGVGVRTLVRMSAAPDRIGGCTRQLTAMARRLGVRLARLDGEHGTGVYATAPTGATIGVAPW